QHHTLAGEGALSRLLEQATENPEPIGAGATVACQGVRGAYSYLAAAHLVEGPARICYERFEDVFAAVKSGECRYGVLPLENSSAGSVGQVYDLLKQGGLYIIKEYDLQVTHCLLGLAGGRLEDIRQVYSHPQALSQCGDFFSKNRGIEAVPCSNTAAAAQAVAQKNDPACAALAHADCAALYGLDILKSNVQNSENNLTRFILLSQTPCAYQDAERIALMLKTSHTPGSLYRMMSRFAARGLNITKLESRPIPERPFEFMFFFEFDGNVRSAGVRALLESLSGEPETFRFLGNYALM
ncbi:MAG: prephenate dehydratase, partial [Acetanaerobacterium sp.]